jgi:tetratricopeptide (TPR) repeat protein
MKTLKVEITEITDETRWAWRLLSSEGTFISDHRVHLDSEAGEFEGLVDLPRFVRWNSESRSDSATERELVGRVARWIGSEVWGAMAPSILEAAEEEPVTVLIEVPAEAEFLLYLPFELPFTFEGKTPGADVSLIYSVADDRSGPNGKHPTGPSLRLLALFSAPVDQIALNTRFERDQLKTLIDQVTATGRAVDLRILQYGVTRAQLEDILEDGEGWDVVHFSGHGLPHGLVLETEEGTADLIPSTEFADLLRPARARLKLVMLNACQSGAVAAAEALQVLGISTQQETVPPEAGDRTLPAAARDLTRGLRCAVVAMRHSVADEFAVKLAIDLYEGLLVHRQSLARSLQRAVTKAAADGAGVSIATPALFGATSRDLLLVPPAGAPAIFDLSASKVAYFDPEPDHFVGRVRQLSRANSALAPKSEKRAIVFSGMAGAGKTACALELVYAHKDGRFEAMVWHRAPNDGGGIEEALAQFVKSLEIQLEGFAFAHAIEDIESLQEHLPPFERLLAERSILVVLDNAESLLTKDGLWRDERWEMIVRPLISHGGRSRFVLTSRVVPVDMDRESVLIESIDTLTANEAVLLASQLPNLGGLISSASPARQPKGRTLVRRTLEVVQGHPKLIEMAEAAAADPVLLEERLAEAGATWTQAADLKAFFNTGESDDALSSDDFLTVLESWTLGVARRLPTGPGLLFQVLCCVEREDRLLELLKIALPLAWEQMEMGGSPPDFEVAIETLATRGLVDVEQRDEDAFYRIHPALEQAERGEIAAEFSSQVATAMGILWAGVFERSQEQGDQKIGVRAALSAAPYLMRLDELSRMVWMLSLVISKDPSSQKIAAVLPLLRRALERTDKPSLGRRIKREILRCQFGLGVRDSVSISELHELVDQFKAAGEMAEAAVTRSTLFNELFRRNRYREAMQLLDPAEDPELSAELSETQKIFDEVLRFQLLQALGDNRTVLQDSEPLRKRVVGHVPAEDETFVFDSANLQGVVLSVARTAAKILEDWDKVLEFNDAIRRTEIAENTSEIMRARTEFNDHSALIELDRLPEAENCLRRVRQAAEQAEDLELLGFVFNAWASIERRRGRPDLAMAFSRKALRTAYRLNLPQSINVAHHNLANHLKLFGGDPLDIAAHRLAEVLISLQTGSGEYPDDTTTLALTILNIGSGYLPSTFAELCDRLAQGWEIDYETFFTQLPPTLANGEEAVAFALSDAYGLLELGLREAASSFGTETT